MVFYLDATEGSMARFLGHLAEAAGGEPKSILLRTTFKGLEWYLRIEPSADKDKQVISLNFAPKKPIMTETETDNDHLVSRLCTALGCYSTEDSTRFHHDIQKWFLIGTPSLMFTNGFKTVLMKRIDVTKDKVYWFEGEGRGFNLDSWWLFYSVDVKGRMPVVEWEGHAMLTPSKVVDFKLTTAETPHQAFQCAIRANAGPLANVVVDSLDQHSVTQLVRDALLGARVGVDCLLTSDDSTPPTSDDLLAFFVRKLPPLVQADIVQEAVLRNKLGVVRFYVNHGLPLEVGDHGVKRAMRILIGMRPPNIPFAVDVFKGLMENLKETKSATACDTLHAAIYTPDLFKILLDNCHFSRQNLIDLGAFVTSRPGVRSAVKTAVQEAIQERIKPAQAWGA